jgi:hypothetical protein
MPAATARNAHTSRLLPPSFLAGFAGAACLLSPAMTPMAFILSWMAACLAFSSASGASAAFAAGAAAALSAEASSLGAAFFFTVFFFAAFFLGAAFLVAAFFGAAFLAGAAADSESALSGLLSSGSAIRFLPCILVAMPQTG